MSESDGPERLEASASEVEAFKARREALHAAVIHLDEDLEALEAEACPAAGVFADALRRLRATLQEHIAGADAPDGLLANILEAAPWFAPRAAQLREEHPGLVERTEQLIARAEVGEDVKPLLAQARALSRSVSDHRHRGTSLLLDAYLLDLSAAD